MGRNPFARSSVSSSQKPALALAPSHVAVLVPSLQKAVLALSKYNFEVGPVESFEETREIYLNGHLRNALLLMEPKGPGSYERALTKRGPGLHHVAIDVLNLDEFLSALSGSGWLLHLNSIRTITTARTAYLARPGFPALIEVHEKRSLLSGPDFVQKISIALTPLHVEMLQALGLSKILVPSDEGTALLVDGQVIRLEALYSQSRGP